VAFRCWRYARNVAGQKVLQDSLYPRRVGEDEPRRLLNGMAGIFPKDFVLKALEKAENDPGFVQFLEQVRDLQTRESE
jgi:hypothetical protein